MFKTNVNLKSKSTPHCYYKGIQGSKPSLIISYKNGELDLTHIDQSLTLAIPPKEALEFISDLVTNLTEPEFDTPPPKSDFTYGLMGFFSFEFGLQLLNIKVEKENPLTPDFYFILPTEYEIENTTYKVLNEKPLFETPSTPTQFDYPEKLESNLTEKQYSKKLDEIKKLLTDGETYQVNFAQEFRTQSKKLPLDLFNELSTNNPSPHQALLQTANFSIISNSPECLYKKTGNKIFTYPIKGTLPKSDDPQKLLDSEKEKAELEMIVDLERNDLGKIAIPGSVKVTKHRYLESYTNVHHTLSEIQADLTPETPFSEIMLALFPGGSVTGCPKKRTSEIIHRLEPTPRGIYCGSLGIIDINGNSEFNILIRSIWMQQNNVSFHSGGGITILSETKNEYQETLDKAKNLENVLK